METPENKEKTAVKEQVVDMSPAATTAEVTTAVVGAISGYPLTRRQVSAVLMAASAILSAMPEVSDFAD